MAGRAEFYYDKDRKQYRKRLKIGGKSRDLWADTKEELRERIRQAKNQEEMGIVFDDSTTVAELAREWYLNRKAGLSYSRQQDYKGAINNHICPAIGNMRLKDVKPEHLQRLMSSKAEYSRTVQENIIGTLKQIFECAEDNGLIFKTPCKKLKPMGKRRKQRKYLTPEQCAQLIEAVKGTRAYLFVMIGIYTGLRPEEIYGLRWCDIDLNNKAPNLTVNNAVRFESNKGIFPAPLKTEEAHRIIPLPPQLVEALKKAKSESNSVFVVPAKDGTCASLQTAKNIRALIRRREIGEGRNADNKHPHCVPSLPFHSTPYWYRHTYITHLCQTGMDIKKIQYLAGHSNIKTTLGIYADVVGHSPQELKSIINASFSGYGSGYEKEKEDGNL